MANLIVLFIIVLIIALSILKIISEKRKGVTCVGCASGNTCNAKKASKKTPFIGQKIEIKQLL